MKKNLILQILFLSILGLNAQTKHTLDSTELTSRVVKDSLDIPWEILWGPDDHIWVTERFGRVSRINPKTGGQNVILDYSSQVYEKSETGMLGMVLHPDFSNNPEVFIAYTYLSGSNIRERLVKFTYNGTNLTASDTLVDNITGYTTHVGSRLIILSDTTLLMTTGDAQNKNSAQNTSLLTGKILRMNLDGSVPADNPIKSSLVYTYGHRNAQGLWLAPNGILYSSEHGPTTDDELNIIKANENYGWPTVAGFCDSPPEIAFCASNNVKEPLIAWTPTIAPSDISWYSQPAIPEFKDKLLMTVLKDKSLIAFGFNATGDSVISQEKFFKNEFGRLRDICVSPDGKIYLATNGTSWSNTRPFTHSIIELSNEAIDHTSVELIASSNGIKIGPNPLVSGEFLNVFLPNEEKGEFTLYDVLGRPVLSETLNGNSSINIQSITGIYFWRIIMNKAVGREGRLIIQ